PCSLAALARHARVRVRGGFHSGSRSEPPSCLPIATEVVKQCEGILTIALDQKAGRTVHQPLLHPWFARDGVSGVSAEACTGMAIALARGLWFTYVFEPGCPRGRVQRPINWNTRSRQV